MAALIDLKQSAGRARRHKSRKAPKKLYKRTSKKVEIKGKKHTIYLRLKDQCACVRRKTKSGKVVYRKVKAILAGGAKPKHRKSRKSLKSRGGCGCAATRMTAGSAGAPLQVEVFDEFAEASDPYMAAPPLDGGAKRLEKNKKTDLYKKARKYQIKGRSKMTKRQLVSAVRAAHKAVGERIRRRGKGRGRRSVA